MPTKASITLVIILMLNWPSRLQIIKKIRSKVHLLFVIKSIHNEIEDVHQN